MRRHAIPVTVVVAMLVLAGCLVDSTYPVGAGNGRAAPGLWRTPGSDGCYWARLSGFSGSIDDIIANDFSSGGPQYVQIGASDVRQGRLRTRPGRVLGLWFVGLLLAARFRLARHVL